jgi:25S rRNA (uracil2843-N3)-methyltransferase
MGRSNTNNSIKKGSNNAKSVTKSKPSAGATVEEIIKQNGAHNIFGLNSSQKILNIIRGAFKEEVNNPEFPDKLRLIKEHFFNREYAKIFENPDYLACYCLNYIPGRSLCYFNMFLQNEPLRELLKGELSIFAMGAGAGSELMGIASAGSVMYNENQKIILNTQDIADWSRELNCLEGELRDQLGQNLNGLETKFSTGSVLNIDEQLEKNINESDLITAMFVINELFVEKTNAMKLITLLISKMKSGSHLLVRFNIIQYDIRY